MRLLKLGFSVTIILLNVFLFSVHSQEKEEKNKPGPLVSTQKEEEVS